MSDYINFKSFVDDYVAIEIPILQRDYAQGRAAQNSLTRSMQKVQISWLS